MRKRIKIIRSAVGCLSSIGFIKELQRFGVKVVGIDASPLSAGFDFSNKSYVVPHGNSPKFIKTILRIIDKENPDAIISGPEEEILALSKNRQKIENKGVSLLCPDFDSVRICADKLKVNGLFKDLEIPSPKIYTSGSVRFPCIVKPRYGRGGTNVYLAQDKNELRIFKERIKSPIIQEYISGDEYSVDVLADKFGNTLSIVPRKRISIESGISIKSQTVYNEEIINYSEKIVKGLKLFGGSCIQCIKSGKDVKFIEVNPRFGGGSMLSIKSDPTIIPNIIRLINNDKPLASKGFKEGLVMLRYYSETISIRNFIK